jgi:hypothetical protein
MAKDVLKVFSRMGTHHQTEALEVAKDGGDHARNTCNGFKKENSLVCVRDNM